MTESLIPVTLLTGFLGSGKTTLLARLLKHPDMKNVAVLINEFGEVGLDHHFVEKLDGEVVLMQSGCLCCTIRNDLAAALRDLYFKRVKGTVPHFDRVVIETTGLADPAPILHTLMSDPVVAARYRLDGIVATIDALNAEATFDRQFESVKQAAVADRIVLTKTDLATPEQIARVRARIAALNPAAPVIAAVKGAVEPEALLRCGLFDPSRKHADVAGWLKAEAYTGHDHEHHHHDHDHDHDHHAAPDKNRHDDHIRAFAITRDVPFTADTLGMWLDALIMILGPDMLRVKGLINLEGEAFALHGVQHQFYPLAKLDEWPDANRQSQVVFITRDIAPEFIQDTLKNLDQAEAPSDLFGRKVT